jgi:hypothetical protein
MSPDRKNLLAIEEEEESLAIATLFLSSSLKLVVPLNFKRKRTSQA